VAPLLPLLPAPIEARNDADVTLSSCLLKQLALPFVALPSPDTHQPDHPPPVRWESRVRRGGAVDHALRCIFGSGGLLLQHEMTVHRGPVD